MERAYWGHSFRLPANSMIVGSFFSVMTGTFIDGDDLKGSFQFFKFCNTEKGCRSFNYYGVGWVQHAHLMAKRTSQ
jgi:hypothetical protein